MSNGRHAEGGAEGGREAFQRWRKVGSLPDVGSEGAPGWTVAFDSTGIPGYAVANGGPHHDAAIAGGGSSDGTGGPVGS